MIMTSIIVPEGFTPEYDDGGISHYYAGGAAKGEGRDVSVDLTLEGEYRIWPATGQGGGDPQLTPAQAVALGEALIELGRKYGR